MPPDPSTEQKAPLTVKTISIRKFYPDLKLSGGWTVCVGLFNSRDFYEHDEQTYHYC